MLPLPVSRGDIWTTITEVANASHRIGRLCSWTSAGHIFARHSFILRVVAGCGFFRPIRSSGRSWWGFFGLWRVCTLGGHASGFGAICVPSARCLQQAALGRVWVVADGSAGCVWLAEACYARGLACSCTNHHGGVGWRQLTRILPI